MAVVELKNVSKVYDNKTRVVDNINLTIGDAEFVVLVGPSGCGKSTTLRMVAGLEEISSGEMYIDNVLINDVSPKDRDIAMVFQNYALYPHMTVFENMAFGLKLRKFDKDEIKRRVLEAARILDLEGLLERKPKALSGGQRQRVAVGRAIVRKPKVFLFDEPLSNLDAKLRVQMRTEISKLHRTLGVTTIYVTHDQTEAMTMGDRIVVMKDGVIQQSGTPLNLYNEPVNKFVAGFIGSPAMNFIDGVLEDNGGMKFRTHGGSLVIDLQGEQAGRLKNSAGRIVTLGVRPEAIQDRPAEGNMSRIRAALEVAEPMGNETLLYFRIENTQVVARVMPREKPAPGEQLDLYIGTGRLHFFDTQTGLAL